MDAGGAPTPSVFLTTKCQHARPVGASSLPRAFRLLTMGAVSGCSVSAHSAVSSWHSRGSSGRCGCRTLTWKAKLSAKRAAEQALARPASNWAVEAASARARATGAEASSGPWGDTAWFHSEVIGSAPKAVALGGPSGAATKVPSGRGEAVAESDKALKQALEKAMEEECRQRLQDASQRTKPQASSSNTAVAAAAAKVADQEVTV